MKKMKYSKETFKCSHCAAVFSTKMAHMDHMKKHHAPGDFHTMPKMGLFK